MSDDLRLTENFWLREFAASTNHAHLVERVPGDLGHRVVRLAVFVLQPIREARGPVTITSGYRSEALNLALGGSPTSQHTAAEAVDFSCDDVRSTFAEIMAGAITIDCAHLGQIILYPERHFIHAALPSQRFPRPTFCVHWPQRGMSYKPMGSLSELVDTLQLAGR